MKKFFFLATLLPFFLLSCQSDLPVPESEECIFATARINYNDELYSFNGSEFVEFDERISLIIPDVNSTPPVIYIRTLELEFCDYLELNFAEYSYSLEDIGNPDGWWYEIEISEQDMIDVLNGFTINAKFKRGNEAISDDSPVFD